MWTLRPVVHKIALIISRVGTGPGYIITSNWVFGIIIQRFTPRSPGRSCLGPRYIQCIQHVGLIDQMNDFLAFGAPHFALIFDKFVVFVSYGVVGLEGVVVFGQSRFVSYVSEFL